MASLTFEAGPVSSAITASNPKADRVVKGYLRAHSVDYSGMTNQEIANAFMALLKFHIVLTSKNVEYAEGFEEKTAEVDADPPEWEE